MNTDNNRLKTKPYISEREYLRLELVEGDRAGAGLAKRSLVRNVLGGAWTLVLFFGALAWFGVRFVVLRLRGKDAS